MFNVHKIFLFLLNSIELLLRCTDSRTSSSISPFLKAPQMPSKLPIPVPSPMFFSSLLLLWPQLLDGGCCLNDLRPLAMSPEPRLYYEPLQQDLLLRPLLWEPLLSWALRTTEEQQRKNQVPNNHGPAPTWWFLPSPAILFCTTWVHVLRRLSIALALMNPIQ